MMYIYIYTDIIYIYIHMYVYIYIYTFISSISSISIPPFKPGIFGGVRQENFETRMSDLSPGL